MGPGCPVTARMHTIESQARDASGYSVPVRDWFVAAFPEGPTPAQSGWLGRRSRRASIHCWFSRPGRVRRWPGFWQSSIGSSEVTSTEHGPWAAFRLHLAAAESGLRRRMVNLAIPLSEIERRLKKRRRPPSARRSDGRYVGLLPTQAPSRPTATHLDHHAGEPLALLHSSQTNWAEHIDRAGVEHVIVDEVHPHCAH